MWTRSNHAVVVRSDVSDRVRFAFARVVHVLRVRGVAAAHRTKPWIACLLVLLSIASAPAGSAYAADARQAATATQALHQLLEDEWAWRLKEFPEWGTSLGEHRYDGLWTDRSPAAIAARRDHHRALLAAVRAIDRSQLSVEDRLSWEFLAFNAETDVRGDELFRSSAPGGDLPFSADDSPLFLVNQMLGPQFDLPQLALDTRFATEADYRNFLQRLETLPVMLQQQRALLEAARTSGWMPPKVPLQRLPAQFASLLDTDLARHPLYAPFKQFPENISPQTQAALAQAARITIHKNVIPAVGAFRDYLVTTYIPAGTTTLAVTGLAHGADYYAWTLQRFNTTRMTVDQIREMGLREVARIDKALVDVMKEAEFKGTQVEFRTFLRTDKRFQFSSAEDQLMAYRDLAKRIDPLLPGLFAVLPRLTYGVRAMPADHGDGAPYYSWGALDGSRGGYFEANTNNLAAWPRWTMEALLLHEAVPGHHIQFSRSLELTDLPKLRRAAAYGGYNEGWALYAEGLGQQLGLYTNPYSRFGRLSMDALRACRLVVDVGLHNDGWSREQAIEYLIEHGQLERRFAESEVDRYLVLPGTSTGYKIGEQKILALRDKAAQELGSRFDLRRFHNAILDHGALPLVVLETSIDHWIAAEKSRPTP